MHQSRATKASDAPTDEERAAFLDAIPPRIFGERYVFAWNCSMHEYLLVQTTEYVTDGSVFHAHVLPFN